MAAATLHVPEQHLRMMSPTCPWTPTSLKHFTDTMSCAHTDLEKIGFSLGLEPRQEENDEDMGLWVEDIGAPPGLQPGPEEKHQFFGEQSWSRSKTYSAYPCGVVDLAEGNGEQSDASKPGHGLVFESVFAQVFATRSAMQGREYAHNHLEILAQLGQRHLAAARTPLAAHLPPNQELWYSSAAHSMKSMTTQRFCHNCGAQRAPSYRFCPHCATRFS
eukprot:TRINITY_DN32105_c0_g1_i1.p1 TRINITY_DN32105_c0_g1~~TRINITY_DN32105_c0_g1_i1.p1  ORF type:complete len:218 (-),score=27.27 TRINITY_DN32105_c0_g1_i1:237-890(-)